MFCGTEWSKIWESEVQRVNRIYCVMCPDEVRGERSGVGTKRRSHFFILIILLQRDFSLSFENLIFSVFLFPRGVRGELGKEKDITYFIIHIFLLHETICHCLRLRILQKPLFFVEYPGQSFAKNLKAKQIHP